MIEQKEILSNFKYHLRKQLTEVLLADFYIFDDIKLFDRIKVLNRIGLKEESDDFFYYSWVFIRFLRVEDIFYFVDGTELKKLYVLLSFPPKIFSMLNRKADLKSKPTYNKILILSIKDIILMKCDIILKSLLTIIFFLTSLIFQWIIW